MNKKILTTLALIMCAVLLTVGTTLAWLTAKTDPVKNTFTAGDIEITLTESDNLDLKMIPGNTIKKDPVVTVLVDSEECWLFIKIEENATVDTFLTYELADGWTELTGVPNVFYREVTAKEAAAGISFSVLKDNQVKVNDTVTKAELSGTMPELTFTAYAVQKANVADATTAWGILNPTASN